MCINWTNKRLDNIRMHGATVKKTIWKHMVKCLLASRVRSVLERFGV